MKRVRAVALLAALTVAAALAACLAPGDAGLLGQWEATVELPPEAGAGDTSVLLRYTFEPGGTYTCAMARTGEELDSGVRLRGNYVALRDRLFFSQGLDHEIDPGEYDVYRLEGDTLILLENAQGDMGGFYPLTLTRVDGE